MGRRVVGLVAIRLENSDGQLLMQLGKWTHGAFSAGCTYLGLLLQEDGSPAECFEQMLCGFLGAFKDGMTLSKVETEKKWARSKSVDVKTHYTRYIHFTDLDPLFEIPEMRWLLRPFTPSERPASVRGSI